MNPRFRDRRLYPHYPLQCYLYTPTHLPIIKNLQQFRKWDKIASGQVFMHIHTK